MFHQNLKSLLWASDKTKIVVGCLWVACHTPKQLGHWGVQGGSGWVTADAQLCLEAGCGGLCLPEIPAVGLLRKFKVALGYKKSSRPASGEKKKGSKKSFPPPPKLNSNPNQTGMVQLTTKKHSLFYLLWGGERVMRDLNWDGFGRGKTKIQSPMLLNTKQKWFLVKMIFKVRINHKIRKTTEATSRNSQLG